MTIMIASDIHGSAFHCKKMLEAFRREKAERLLLLGDILYHGPRNPLPEDYSPREVSVMLNAYADRIVCVRGNCDSEVDQMVLDFPLLADYGILFSGKRILYFTHGHTFNKEKHPPLLPGDILIHGHTHIPLWENFGKGNLCLNPGSVSLPKKNTSHSYMTLEGNIFLWKNLDGAVYHSVEA